AAFQNARRRIQTQVRLRLLGSMTLVAAGLKNRLNVADEIDGGLRLGGILGGHGGSQRRGDGRNRETRKGTSPHRAAPDRRSGEREGNTESRWYYSPRKTMMGSTCVARRAGR